MPNVNAAIFWARMGWVDVVLIVVFFLGVFFGLRKGLAGVLSGLIEVLAAQIVVVEYHASFAASLAGKFNLPPHIAKIVVFSLLAVVCVLAVRFSFKLLALIVTVDFKQPLNHLGGVLVGGLQFVLFLALICQFLMLFQIPYFQESINKRSWSGRYLIHASEQVHYFFQRWVPKAPQAQS